METPRPNTDRRRMPRGLTATLLVGAGAIVLSACSGGGSPNAGATATTTSAGSASAAYTVKAASVAGAGTVLVNGSGMTLYILTSEEGGKILCTDASGCTKVWPDTELPKGVSTGIAGAGIDSSKLSTVKSADGSLYITYAGYPLYTYSGDTGPGQAKGTGITSFGGTWYPIAPDGTLVTSVS